MGKKSKNSVSTKAKHPRSLRVVASSIPGKHPRHGLAPRWHTHSDISLARAEPLDGWMRANVNHKTWRMLFVLTRSIFVDNVIKLDGGELNVSDRPTQNTQYRQPRAPPSAQAAPSTVLPRIAGCGLRRKRISVGNVTPFSAFSIGRRPSALPQLGSVSTTLPSCCP